MRTIYNIGLFGAGLFIALASVSSMRLAPGAWGVVQFPIIILVLAVFYLKEDRLIFLVLGIGLGLDVVSSYPYLTWTMIVGGAAFGGRWIAKNVLTNRSLPSLMLLAAAMRSLYFLLELVGSRSSALVGGTVWYRPGAANFSNVVLAFVIEMIALAIFFIIHIRVRGERSRMLTHI